MFHFVVIFIYSIVLVSHATQNNDILSAIYGNSYLEDDRQFTCPAVKTIAPCICDKPHEQSEPVITCSNITDVNKLNSIFRKTNNIPFRIAHFYNLSLPHFPAESFNTKQYKHLFIGNSAFVSLFDKQPSKNRFLEVIQLSNIHLHDGVDLDLFTNFKELLSMEIINTTVNALENSIRYKLPKKIIQMRLESTKTNTIPEDAFAFLKDLESLSIINNAVTFIKRNMLPLPYVGSQINLSGNNIKNLPSDFFKKMPYLMSLDLQRNSITTISQSVIASHPPNLRAIFIQGNPINCDCNLKWIVQHVEQYLHMDGECMTPNANKGKLLSELTISDFNFCS